MAALTKSLPCSGDEGHSGSLALGDSSADGLPVGRAPSGEKGGGVVFAVLLLIGQAA